MIVLFALILSGCYRETKVPIPAIYYETNSTKDNCTLFVYLPGNGDSPDAFEKQGLFRSLQEQGIAAEMVGVDAHLGYYSNNSLVVRLKEDVIDPARVRGSRNIWLVGNSLGGVGSLMYIRKHADEIAGVVLLGPFVGDEEIIEEIKRSGGLQNWDPGQCQGNGLAETALGLAEGIWQRRTLFASYISWIRQKRSLCIRPGAIGAESASGTGHCH